MCLSSFVLTHLNYYSCTSFQIDSVELWEAQGKTVPLKYKLSRDTSAFARELQAHELFFTSSNGAVVNVSPELGESSKILNIKKGILSALQVQFIKNKQATLKEVRKNCYFFVVVVAFEFCGSETFNWLVCRCFFVCLFIFLYCCAFCLFVIVCNIIVESAVKPQLYLLFQKMLKWSNWFKRMVLGPMPQKQKS